MDIQSPNQRQIPLADAVQITAGKLIHAGRLPEPSTRPEDTAPMLIFLAAGKGTRFGAEYGTGVRAGSLDQATEQKGKAGQGALISSNPNDNYRLLGTYPAPTDRFRVIYPYTIDRDREAWKWSAGMFGESATDPLPTTGEIRKLTGKAAEIAAIDRCFDVDPEIIQPHPGGGAAGIRLSRFDRLPELIHALETLETIKRDDNP